MYQEGQPESTNVQQNRASGRLSLIVFGDPATIPLLFPNAPLESLTTGQAHLALTTPLALKFPRDVSPFCAVREYSRTAFEQLHSLFQPGESSFLVVPNIVVPNTAHHPGLEIGALSSTPSSPVAIQLHPNDQRFTGLFRAEGTSSVAQMVWPDDLPIPDPDPTAPPIVPIEPSQADEMMELIAIAFPGYFRIATIRMGPYYGIRSETTGKLVAMVGERMNINNFHELSGLCTHPDHRGKGYAQHLMYHLMRSHKSNGFNTYLHTGAGGAAAKLYQRMGFTLLGEFQMLNLSHV